MTDDDLRGVEGAVFGCALGIIVFALVVILAVVVNFVKGYW